MLQPWARRVAALMAVAVLSLTACSTGPTTTPAAAPAAEGSSPSADAFPVTVKHAFGSTTVKAAPTRVATVSWVNADVALALGVVPVGMPKDEWGGNQQGSTPWKDAALGRLDAAIGSPAAPAQYSELDGVNYTEMAKLNPDVILAAYSGITKEEYDKLSKIAPVVAYPEVAYGTPWQDATRLVGQALGRSAEAERVVSSTEQAIADQVARYPQLKGKTFIYGNLEPAKGAGVNLYTEFDNRPRFLSLLGMQLAPVVAKNAKGKAFYIEWSPERADELEADVFVTWVADDKTVEAIKKDPLLKQIPAVERGALVADPSSTLTLAISASSPLSLPWALDQFLPQLNAAVERTG